MRKNYWLVLIAVTFATLLFAHAQGADLTDQVRKALEKSTLDQPGTKPFHLKASYAPSRERDWATHREGDIEIWWESPTRWRREVRSPDFHQVAIVDGPHQWQKNDGDYFPEWLREMAVAIVRPVPLPTDVLLERVKTAEVRHMRFPPKSIGQMPNEQTNFNWEASGAPGDAPRNGKGYLALLNDQLFYTGGPGWDGLYHDFKDFHGRQVARTVAAGIVEVTAKINVLEDLGPVPPGFFDATAPGGDAHPIDTVVLDQAELRQNLLPGSKPFEWPALKDGPLEGMTGTDIVVDRTGKVREMDPPISDNGGVNSAAAEGFRSMQFKPFERDGVVVQAFGRLTVPFKTVRPEGVENFDSARTYFDRGRKVSFLAAAATAPYFLRAEFQVSIDQHIQTGRYEDTWLSATEWKREAWVGSSHLVRSQMGHQRYSIVEGDHVGVLKLVMLLMEPIPSSETMTESDWRIGRDRVSGTSAIRVFRGPEGPNGELDLKSSEGYWFDESGHLIKAYKTGFEILLSKSEAYSGVQVARQIDLMKDGKLGMQVSVKEIGVPNSGAEKTFALKGHEWEQTFTAEVR